MVVLLYKTLQLEWHQERSKHPDRKQPAGRFQQRVSELLQMSTATVARLYKEFNEHRDVTEARPPGNYNPKTKRLADTPEVLRSIRSFVNNCNAKRRPVTGKHVLDHLVEKGFMVLSSTSRKEQRGGLRVVQRYLCAHGFRLSSRGGQSWQEKEQLRVQRLDYLHKVRDNLSLPADKQLRMVYCGDSHVQHQAPRHPEPKDELPSAERLRGPPLCFAAAITGRHPEARAGREERLSPDREAHLVEGSFHVFDPRAKLNCRDARLSAEIFMDWFKDNLLANLKEPSMIVLDSAAHHTAKPARLSQRSIDKLPLPALLELAQELKMRPPDRVNKVSLRYAINSFVAANVEPEIVTLAKQAGHTVVFVPRHHSDLQPMELCWAHWRKKLAAPEGGEKRSRSIQQRLDEVVAATKNEGQLVHQWIEQVRKAEDELLLAEEEQERAEQRQEHDGGDGDDAQDEPYASEADSNSNTEFDDDEEEED
jgi:transposase